MLNIIMYSYKIKCIKLSLPTIQLDIVKRNNITIADNKYNILLNESKNKIDKYYIDNLWDKTKKICNPYELIYITNKKTRNKSMALYEPLSRSYFKMIELSHIFLKEYYNMNYISTKINVKSLHLAEGPGGFIEAWNYFRNYNMNDKIYGMTLIDKNKDIPGWSKTCKYLKNNKINIISGIDGTGNLYNYKNILYLVNRLGKHTVDIITGDGGFDFSISYNMQELYASKLIFCQVLAAIKCQKKGGTFICKFFDTNNILTIQILYLLQCLYKEITFYKPFTSRVANSEKYIVCSDYIEEIDDNYWNRLLSILLIWNNIDNEYKIINNIFQQIPNSFINYISNLNHKIINTQILQINKTISIIEDKPLSEWYINNRELQINNAIKWCKKFNISFRSEYII